MQARKETNMKAAVAATWLWIQKKSLESCLVFLPPDIKTTAPCLLRTITHQLGRSAMSVRVFLSSWRMKSLPTTKPHTNPQIFVGEWLVFLVLRA